MEGWGWRESRAEGACKYHTCSEQTAEFYTASKSLWPSDLYWDCLFISFLGGFWATPSDAQGLLLALVLRDHSWRYSGDQIRDARNQTPRLCEANLLPVCDLSGPSPCPRQRCWDAVLASGGSEGSAGGHRVGRGKRLWMVLELPEHQETGGSVRALCVLVGRDPRAFSLSCPHGAKSSTQTRSLCAQGPNGEVPLATTAAAENTPGVPGSTAREPESDIVTSGTPTLEAPSEHSGEGPTPVSCPEHMLQLCRAPVC